MTDTLETVRGWLKRITYKPDTELWAVEGIAAYAYGRQDVIVRVRRHLPDSTTAHTMGTYTDRSRFIPVGSQLHLPPHIYQAHDPFAEFVQWLHHALLNLERHETDEWFRVDGALPFDPHREDRR